MQIHPQVTISDPLLGTHQGKTHPLCFIYRVTTNSKATGTQKFSLFFLSWSDGRGNGAILGLSEAPGEEWVSLGKEGLHTPTLTPSEARGQPRSALPTSTELAAIRPRRNSESPS